MKRLLGALAAWKLFLLAFVAGLARWRPQGFNAGNFGANFHWPPDAAPSFPSFFSTWDAQHFLYLSRHGYEPGSLSNNFFPLWPWLMRAAGAGLPAGLVLANLFSLAALALFYHYVKERRDEKTARLSLLFLLAYPGAFFLCLPFSESLFLLLVMLLFLAIYRDRLGAASGAVFLLALSRPQGLLVALPFWYVLWRRERTSFQDLAFWLSPLLGLAAYLLFMQRATGDALEGFKAYRDIFPGGPSALKLLDPAGFARTFLHVTAWHGTTGSLMERAWFVLFLCCLPPLWKRDRVLFLYALPMGVVPAVALSFVSFTRHLLLVFPVFIVLAEFFARRPPAFRRVLLAASALFQLYLLALHANNFWVA